MVNIEKGKVCVAKFGDDFPQGQFDEIAFGDVVIELFDFIGYLGLNPKDEVWSSYILQSVPGLPGQRFSETIATSRSGFATDQPLDPAQQRRLGNNENVRRLLGMIVGQAFSTVGRGLGANAAVAWLGDQRPEFDATHMKTTLAVIAVNSNVDLEGDRQVGWCQLEPDCRLDKTVTNQNSRLVIELGRSEPLINKPNKVSPLAKTQ